MNAATSQFRYVPLSVDGVLYCLDSRSVRGVFLGEDCELFDQELSGGIVGEFHYQDEEIPVIRLRSLLETNGSSVPSQEYLLVVATAHAHCGFLVDDVLRAREFAPESLWPLPTIVQNPERPFFLGIAQWNDATSSVESHRLVDLSASEGIDRGVQGEAERGHVGALILSQHGLLGMEETATNPFVAPHLESIALLSDAHRKRGQLMLFEVAHQTIDDRPVSLAFSVSELMEITRPSELLPVPACEDHIFGLLAWRNQFVPVVDLTQQLGLGPVPVTSRQRLAVVRSMNGQLFAFYTDPNVRAVRMPLEAQAYRTAGLAGIEGSYLANDGTLLLLPKSTAITEPKIPHFAA